MNIKINRITLGVANIKRTIQFYDTWLGIKPYELTINLLLYQIDNIILAFVPFGKLADDLEGVYPAIYNEKRKQLPSI